MLIRSTASDVRQARQDLHAGRGQRRAEDRDRGIPEEQGAADRRAAGEGDSSGLGGHLVARLRPDALRT